MSENDKNSSVNKTSQRLKLAPTLTLLNGNTVRVLTKGDSTDQRLTVIEYVDTTCGSPPPFTRHDFIEVFAVQKGRLMFQYLGEAPFIVLAGDAVTVPSGFSHTFWNPDNQPLHLVLACTPAGLDGFFEAVHDVAVRVKKGDILPTDAVNSVAELRIKYGIEETAPAPCVE